MKNCIQPKSHQKGHGKLAVITGADGGMGMEITRYVALAPSDNDVSPPERSGKSTANLNQRDR